MKEFNIVTVVQEFASAEELPDDEKELLEQALKATENAYAPYSKFRVGAALKLEDGSLITGSNQENASSPVGICAEGVAFSTASAIKPGVAINKVAITINSDKKINRDPVAPCGICRQRILEYENRFNRSIIIILKGEGEKVYRVDSVKSLLPLAFSSY